MLYEGDFSTPAGRFAVVAARFNAGELRPPVDRVFALTEARAAYERLAHAEQFGKVVIRID